VRLAPETIIMVYPSERTYLRQLRMLGAWWCLGSSALVPRLLLQYPPAPLGIFGRLMRSPLGVDTARHGGRLVLVDLSPNG
jgi:hypothetical protein